MSRNTIFYTVLKPLNTRQRRFVAGERITEDTDLLPHDRRDLIKRRILKKLPANTRA